MNSSRGKEVTFRGQKLELLTPEMCQICPVKNMCPCGREALGITESGSAQKAVQSALDKFSKRRAPSYS